MPATDDDIATARALLEEERRALRDEDELDLGPVGDAQVSYRALWVVFERDPNELSVDELTTMYERLLAVASEFRMDRGYDATRLLAVADRLDARGGLTGPPDPPQDAADCKEWALGRVGRLGEIAWSSVPSEFRRWLHGRSVTTLRAAGVNRPSESALRRYCAS